MIKVVAITGPSGVGKSSVIKHVLKLRDDFAYVPSDTTRAMGETESQGDPYYFLSKEKFKQKINKGRYLEHNEHYDNFYGIDRERFIDIISKGKTVIKDIDVDGAMKLKNLYKEYALTVYLKPPSDEELFDRLCKRSRGLDSNESRLARIVYEESLSSNFDAIVVNVNLMKTVRKVLRLYDKIVIVSSSVDS